MARQAGLEADGLAVADEATVAQTLARLARDATRRPWSSALTVTISSGTSSSAAR